MRAADGGEVGNDDELAAVSDEDWKSSLELRDNIPLRNEVELVCGPFNSAYSTEITSVGDFT